MTTFSALRLGPVVMCRVFALCVGLAVSAVSCGGTDDPKATGQSSFETSLSEGGGHPAFDSANAAKRGGEGAVSGTGGGTLGIALSAPAPGFALPDVKGASGGVARFIEEGDIVKVAGDLLYVLNRNRGLQVIDLSRPDQPALLSRVAIGGEPREMYVRGTTVLALATAHSDYSRCADCEGGVTSTFGSTLAAIDVGTPNKAHLLAQVQIKGTVSDSRLVGDILYAVSERYATSDGKMGADNINGSEIVSVDVANSAMPRLRGSLTLPRLQGQNHIHMTDRLLYVASSGYGTWMENACVAPTPPPAPAPGGGETRGSGTKSSPPSAGVAVAPGTPGSFGPCSRLTAVDIAAPDGQIKTGATYDLPGTINDRWSMDHHKNVLRVVVSNAVGRQFQPPRVVTLKAGNASELSALGQVDLRLTRPEIVTAVRFDGDRAFVVTFQRTDPLFTIDLSNPAMPAQMGELKIPGWIDHIEPRGSLLVALGHDSPSGNPPFALHVSLIDVSDLANPTQTVRQQFGDGMASIPGRRDDWAKVFRVLDDQKLVLVPYSTYYYRTQPTPQKGQESLVQLMDLDLGKGTLTKRGAVVHEGNIERAVPWKDKVLAVSTQAVQVIDVADRDKPKIRGVLSLSRRVEEVYVTGSGALLQVLPSDNGQSVDLFVVGANDPDGEPAARQHVSRRPERIIVNGNFAYLVFNGSNNNGGATEGPVVPPPKPSRDPGSSDPGSSMAGQAPLQPLISPEVHVFELGATIRPRGKVIVPAVSGLSYENRGGGPDVTRAGGSTLVLGLQRPDACSGVVNEDDGAAVPTPGMRPKETAGAGGSSGSSPPPMVMPPVAPVPGIVQVLQAQRKCEIQDDLAVLDLSNPDMPVVASMLRFADAAAVMGGGASGTTFFAAHFEEVPGKDRNNRVIVKAIRFYVTTIDLTNPRKPVRSPAINVPGLFLGARLTDRTFFTLEPKEDPKTGESHITLHALYNPPGSNKAYLQSKLDLGNNNAVQVDDRGAYVVVDGALVAVDTSNPQALRIASRTQIPGAQRGGGRGGDIVAPDFKGGGGSFFAEPTYANLEAVIGGHAFVRVNTGLLAYDLRSPSSPVFEGFARTQSGNSAPALSADGLRAFLAAGETGVQVLDLGTR